jgi:hypothetical protein
MCVQHRMLPVLFRGLVVSSHLTSLSQDLQSLRASGAKGIFAFLPNPVMLDAGQTRVHGSNSWRDFHAMRLTVCPLALRRLEESKPKHKILHTRQTQ